MLGLSCISVTEKTSKWLAEKQFFCLDNIETILLFLIAVQLMEVL